MITFKASFDDGDAENIRLADLMRKYEIPNVIFYIPVEWMALNAIHDREGLTFGELESLAKEFEVGSHTINHPMLTRIPLWQAEIEIKESKSQLEDMLGVKVESFCYPRGYANDEIRKIVRENYKTARNTLVGELKSPEDPVWESTTVHIGGKRRKDYEGSTWLEHGLRLLDEAMERSKNGEEVVYSMFGHSWELTREKAWDDFEILLKRIYETPHTQLRTK